jgi:hypothetical protein
VAVVLSIAFGGWGAQALAANATRGEAAAVAASINLRRGDLPRVYLEQRFHANSVEARENAQLDRCFHSVPVSEALLVAQSPTFTTAIGDSLSYSPPPGSPTVSSDVEVWPSPALAQRHLVPDARAIACDEAVFPTPKGVTVTATTLPPVVHGADRAWAYRFTARSSQFPPPSHREYVDLLGFVYGQVQVGIEINTELVAPELFPEQRLAKLLLARTRNALRDSPPA